MENGAHHILFSRDSLEKHVPGFGLVEMAIALVILGIIASFGAPALRQAFQHQRYLKKQKSLDRVEESIIGFLGQNHRLPCPGDHGVEERSSAKKCLNSVGKIPFKTLGIPKKETEGLIYGVDIGLSSEEIMPGIPVDNVRLNYQGDTSSSRFCHRTPTRTLQVDMVEGHRSSVVEPQQIVAYILVDSMTRRPVSEAASPDLSTYAKENLNGDHVFIAEAPGLTHQVRWKTRDALAVSFIGKACVRR